MADETTTTTATTEPTTAESGGGDPKSTTAAITATATQTEQPKTSTQTDVDKIVNDRLAREKAKLPTKDELSAFKKWQDEQKTVEQKHADEIKAANEAKTAAEQKAIELEAKYTAMSKGVNASAVDDVVALARGKVSETVTLEQAIDTVLAKYPQFGTVAPTAPATTGTATTNNQAAAAADDAKVRAVMGLPPKK